MADEVVLNAAEIARLAGVARGTVLTWRRRHDFPAPYEGAHAGAVYNRAEVQAWLATAGLLELAPGPRVWREVSHGAQGRSSLGEAVSDAAMVAARLGDGKALPPSVPGNLAWLMKSAVDEVGPVTVLNDLLDRYAAASGIPVTAARIRDAMISLAGVGDGATVLDPASGTGELLAAALAGGAGRVLAQDASIATAELARARLFLAEGQSAEVAAGDAKPGGRAVLAMPPSAAAAPSGRQARAQMLRQGAIRTVIALPVAVAPPYVPMHLWVLERPDGKTEPDLLALFVEAAPEVRAGADYATSSTAGTVPTASWRDFMHSIEIAGDSAPSPGKRLVCSGGGRNAKWCVTRVADLLDDTGLLDNSERLDETVDLTPARVRAHFSAWHREKNKESSLRRARSGHAELLRAGDVLVPATVTNGTGATVVGEDRDGDPAGQGMHVIRPNPAHLNSWFLAGFLLSPGNLRRATGNRVDVRQLEAPLPPLADQERYAWAFRNMRSLESITGNLKDRAAFMASNLTSGLASGDFRPGRETSPPSGIPSQ